MHYWYEMLTIILHEEQLGKKSLEVLFIRMDHPNLEYNVIIFLMFKIFIDSHFPSRCLLVKWRLNRNTSHV